MNGKIFLSLIAILYANYVFADNNLGAIVQRQSKQIQELKARLLELENTVEDLKMSMKISDSTSEFLPETKKMVEGFDSETLLAEPSDKVDYDLALATLKSGNFDLAEENFSDFIKNHPSSDLQSNATFWYAEVFFRKKEFDKAAINFLQSYKKYPDGAKASDALLKASYSLAKIDKNKEACSMLKKLELEFPNRSSDSIERAKEARSEFNCN